jgi:hypothetical protein
MRITAGSAEKQKKHAADNKSITKNKKALLQVIH